MKIKEAPVASATQTCKTSKATPADGAEMRQTAAAKCDVDARGDGRDGGERVGMSDTM